MGLESMNLKPVEESFVLKDKVYEALKSAILSMDIYSEDTETKLDERRLAEELGVSRTPIREALMLLEKEGLVKMIPRRGAFVLRKTKREILEMICVWGALEGQAARLVSAGATDSELTGLKAVLVGRANPKKKLAEISEYASENIKFHQKIIGLSKCALMSDISEGLFVHIRAVLARSSEGLGERLSSPVDHLKIIQALQKRDGALADKLIREHTTNLSKYIERHVDWIG